MGMEHCLTLLSLLLVSWTECSVALTSTYDHSMQIHPGYKISWSIANEEIKLAIEAKASGWVAFGISEAGGMKGADIVYFERTKNVLTDAFAMKNEKPVADSCSQDWVLKTSAFEAGMLSVEMTRKLQVTDTQDRSISQDGALPWRPTSIIGAWGDDKEISYHGTGNRVKGTVRFYQSKIQSAEGSTTEERLNAMARDSSLTRHMMVNSNYTLKLETTEYYELCTEITTLINSTAEHHIVGFEAYINPTTAKHVHHFVLHAGDSCDRLARLAMTVVWVWGPGHKGTVMPDDAGVKVLGANGFKVFRLQYHYDNPGKVQGLVDTSGFSFYTSVKLRTNDVGILQLGDPMVLKANQRVRDASGNGYSKITLTSAAAGCTDQFAVDKVTVFDRFLHMHQAGEQMVTKHYAKDGQLKRNDSIDFFDFREQGAFSPRSTGAGFTIEKGDYFVLDCYYYQEEGQNIVFGLGSHEEMCIDFLYYYPRQSRPRGGLCIATGDSLAQPATVLASVKDLERKLGFCSKSSGSTSLKGRLSAVAPLAMTLLLSMVWARRA